MYSPTFWPVFRPSAANTSPIPWIKTHHITASVITPHRPNNFNSQNFNNHPLVTCIYITHIILTEIIILIFMECHKNILTGPGGGKQAIYTILVGPRPKSCFNSLCGKIKWDSWRALWSILSTNTLQVERYWNGSYKDMTQLITFVCFVFL
jgi:hypothetical protein